MKKLVSAIAALAMSVSSFTAFAAAGDEATVLSNALTDAAALTNTDAYTWGADVAGLIQGEGLYLTNDNNKANNYTDKSLVTFTDAVGDATHKVNVSYSLKSKQDKGQAVTSCIMSYYDADGNLLFSISEGSGNWAYTSTLTYATADGTATASLPGHGKKGTVMPVSFELTYTNSGNLITIDGTAYSFVGGGINDIKFSVADAQDYSRGMFISNYTMKTTEVAAATPANYTINYLYDGEVVSTDSGTSMVGAEVIADSVVTTAAGEKYFAADDATLNMTLVDGENVLNVNLRTANAYSVTVNAVGDLAEEIKTETILEGDSKTVVWPMYIVKEGVAYVAKAFSNPNPYYGQTVSNPTGDTTIEVTYTKTYENVVLYDELDATDGENAGVRASNCSAYNNAAYTSAVNLEPGVYTVVTRLLNKGRGSTLTVGDTTVFATDKYGKGSWNTDTTTEVVVTEAAPLVWNAGGSNTYDCLDTILVVKTGDIEVTPDPVVYTGTIEVFGTYSGDGYEGEATALTATFEIAEDESFDTVTIASAANPDNAVTKTVTTVTGGSAVYGIVVTSICDETAVVATATLAE